MTLKHQFMSFSAVALLLASLLAGCTNQTSGVPGVSFNVYFYNSQGWTGVKAYAWTVSGGITTELLGVWPGASMVNEGGGWYSMNVANATESFLIFSNTSGQQTADLSRKGDGTYIYGQWFDGDLRKKGPMVFSSWGTTSGQKTVLPSDASLLTFQTIPSDGLTVQTYNLTALKDNSVVASGSLTGGALSLNLGPITSTASSGDVFQLNIHVENSVATADPVFTFKVMGIGEIGGYSEEFPHSTSDPWIPLGAFYNSEKGKTFFRLWSPDTSQVTVSYDGISYPMEALPNFGVYSSVYEYSVIGNLSGVSYQFSVNGTPVRDPYGLMLDASGRNVLMEMNSTSTLPVAWNPDIVSDGGYYQNREDGIIYEVHVRDFTIDSSWGGTATLAGKYKGLVESGTLVPGTAVATGLDHLKELGVTHIQLLPVYDFGSTMYNWGYDPVNYNIPEEQYSSFPLDPSARVKEFREMVKGFHDKGLRVVMDVVYNHTQSRSVFDSITPRYYRSSDLSGTGGGTLNSAEPMVSRMIRDSLDQWVSNYGVDGFRFDLLGIFHTSAVKDWGIFLNTKHPNKNLLLYGEPWNGYADDPEEAQKVRLGTVQALTSAHVGVFNGEFRDNIKGDSDSSGKGYIQGDITSKAGVPGIVYGLRGSPAVSAYPGTWNPQFTGDPEQTINYASAHDNYCLWDKVVYSNGKTWVTASQSDKNIAQFGLGILLVSQGIPFIHAGDEFLRTKTTDGAVLFSDDQVKNSYEAPDSINKINWDWKNTNGSTFSKVKDLIALRKSTSNLRLTTITDIMAKIPTTNITTTLTGVIIVKIDANLILILNPSTTTTYTVLDTVLTGAWNKIWSSSDSSGTVTNGDVVSASSLVVYSR